MGGRLDGKTHAKAVSKIEGVVKYAPEIREHVDEIVKGPAFKGSHRSQALLKHIVEHALAGDSESLRERIIGVELFSRPASYDTGEDAVVRVAASDVRRRLLQHYGSAGADAQIRIEIPPGSYIPEFHRIVPDDAPPPAPPPVPELVDESSLSALVAPALPPVLAPAKTRTRSAAIGFGILLILVGGSAGFAISRWLANTPPTNDDLISAMFQGAPEQMQVILSDEGLVLAELILGRGCSLQSYEDLSCLNDPQLLQEDASRRIQKALATRQISNVGDLQNAARIAENLHLRTWDVNILHARQVHARTFRKGNFIILGGSFSNPWAGIFKIPNSNFPLEEPPPVGRGADYLNLKPLPGEPTSFPAHKGLNGEKTTTYARVALVDNISQTGRVLLVTGQSVSATEMAAGFLFFRGSASKVRRSLGIWGNGPLPNLEMILRVTEVNQIGDGVELVACRKIERRAS